MTNTITTSAPGIPSVTPRLVLDWQTSQQTRTVVHDLLYSAAPVVTMRPPAPRRGTLKYLFASASEAQACYAMHLVPAVLTLNADISDTSVTLRYVVADGDLVLSLDSETALVTILEVPYREVPA